MTKTRFQQALGDVSRVFEHARRPSSKRADLTEQQKIDLLKQWETDLRLLMVASEENMTGNAPGRTSELLRQVLGGLEKLGASESQSRSAPNKAGG